jgi:sulfatase modifying factor 1
MARTCCFPTKQGSSAEKEGRLSTSGRPPASLEGSILVKGGISHVGTNRPIFPADGEAPRRPVILKSFRLSQTATTNAAFAAFVDATGYVSDAERVGSSFVFYDQISPAAELRDVPGFPWWKDVVGASWREPGGSGSTIHGFEDRPVTQVSCNDATAYAAWAGGRLPSEAEWEHAARGGLVDPAYPWGDTPPDDDGHFPCNIWQGQFPLRNTAADGHAGLAPVRSFSPNGLGFYNMSGNTWEWTSDGPGTRQGSVAEETYVLKGGSYLCHASYCHRYRIAARLLRPASTATSHIGFRIAFEA